MRGMAVSPSKVCIPDMLCPILPLHLSRTAREYIWGWLAVGRPEKACPFHPKDMGWNGLYESNPCGCDPVS